MKNDRRLVILGLDSLPPELVSNLAESGVMPFLNELIEKGSFGTLRSVTPAHTASGWNSAWTGQLPEVHKFFMFNNYHPQDDSVRLATSVNLKIPAIWEMLNSHGYKTIVINSPMQYPVTELDGIMVSGFMAPSLQSSSVYPPSFKEKLTREIPDYIFDVPWDIHHDDDNTFERNIAAVLKIFKQRIQVTKLAASCGPWDAMIVVFKSIDNMLHYTWDYITDEKADPKRRKKSLEALRALDDSCRQIAVMAGYPDINILLFSDHGHCSIDSNFYPNDLLKQWGYLVPLTKFEKSLNKFVNSFRKRLKLGGERNVPKKISERMKIKWNKSKAALIMGGTNGVIFLNVKGRQPQGVVEPQDYQALRKEIADRFAALKNESTGTRLIVDIICPKLATPYPLPPGEIAIPDIIFGLDEGIHARHQFRKTKGPAFQPGRVGSKQGGHKVDGFILGAGQDFAKGNSLDANIYDIAPTVLAAYGLPVPRGLKGKPITQMLASKEKMKFEEKDRIKAVKSKTSSIEAYSKEEEELVQQRLANLGYLD